jgi:hypothetical protein
MVNIDSEDVIFCCPKALMGERFFVQDVTMAPAGDKLALLCASMQNLACVEVHGRISDTACVRLMHIPLSSASGYTPIEADLCILTFSPCGRFLVWKASTANGGPQALMSVCVSEESMEAGAKVDIVKLNSVESNMPREFLWRSCGVWMRLRRGTVLVQS